jgi:hypothetical protein
MQLERQLAEEREVRHSDAMAHVTESEERSR